ncbi:MAG: flavin reductase family protein [Longimicrobiales bacterium]|nr:flavin reductase family protein [Longimicrobiales bacterium]
MVKRVGRHVGGGPEPEEERARRERDDAYRDALSRWASGVSIVAVREGGSVHALTVSAFIPVSLDPPSVLVSLGPNAAVLPFLDPGVALGISLLAADQKGVASRYADTFPVGPSPFRDPGPPVVRDCVAWLACEVQELLRRGDHTLVISRITAAGTGPDRPALTYFRRGYHSVG